MKQSSESTAEQKFTSASKVVLSLFILIFCLAGTIEISTQLLELKWKWLGTISMALFVISGSILAISGMAPGILIALRTPWFARAWLRGINTVVVWNTPWEKLSGIQKFSIYFWSISSSVFTLLAIIAFIAQAIGK